jgi:hypothetical protein|tara:strand:- start:1320 stop:1457 length:138 start_codon:yes stop_codon:yes gene_type:complete
MKKTLLIVLPPLPTVGCEKFQDFKIDGVIWMVFGVWCALERVNYL